MQFIFREDNDDGYQGESYSNQNKHETRIQRGQSLLLKHLRCKKKSNWHSNRIKKKMDNSGIDVLYLDECKVGMFVFLPKYFSLVYHLHNITDYKLRIRQQRCFCVYFPCSNNINYNLIHCFAQQRNRR